MTDMRYRMMGNTGIQVSVLSYGFWATYGVKDNLQGDRGIETAIQLRIAHAAGINCFDHAEAYDYPMAKQNVSLDSPLGSYRKRTLISGVEAIL